MFSIFGVPALTAWHASIRAKAIRNSAIGVITRSVKIVVRSR